MMVRTEKGTHYRLNDEENRFEKVYVFSHSFTTYTAAKNSQMIFVNNNLFLFGGDNESTDIFQCKITKNYKTQKIKWKKCDLKLPEAMSFRFGCKCIVAFNNIVIIFKFAFNGVVTRWYLDLGDIQDKELNNDNYEWIGDKIKLGDDDDLPK